MAAATGPGPMKRMALALLVGVALLYALATWQEARGGHAGWGWLAAFAEAAMVGAIADWFAVVALFRHPLGLPIPHTAILPRSKTRLGANLARFFCDNFLGTAQVLAKLRAFDAAGRLAAWLSRPAQAERLGRLGVAAAGQVMEAVDDQRLRDFLGRAAAAGLRQLDFSRTAGQVLETLTAEGRHQAMLDAVLGHAAQWLDDEALQDQLTESIAQEVKALRYVGLDQVAARLATRKLVASIARALGETAADPAHPLRQRFDATMQSFVQRLQQDPAFVARGERLRDELLAHDGLRNYLDGLWQQLRDWLQADLARPDSAIGQRIARLAASLGERLASDAGMRAWLNEQLEQAAPAAIERWREDIRRYIEQRVADWDTDELVAELEQHMGRDLQFIRINGTVVGGLVGVAIHALTLMLR